MTCRIGTVCARDEKEQDVNNSNNEFPEDFHMGDLFLHVLLLCLVQHDSAKQKRSTEALARENTSWLLAEMPLGETATQEGYLLFLFFAILLAETISIVQEGYLLSVEGSFTDFTILLRTSRSSDLVPSFGTSGLQDYHRQRGYAELQRSLGCNEARVYWDTGCTGCWCSPRGPEFRDCY